VFERLGPMVDALRADGPFRKWLRRYHEVIRCQTDVLQFMAKGPQEATKARGGGQGGRRRGQGGGRRHARDGDRDPRDPK
jgi:hypothetical protein